MENYLMNGETSYNNAVKDNDTIIDLTDNIGGELENIVECGFSSDDFKSSYKSIINALDKASSKYTFTTFSLNDDLNNTLDNIDDSYYWFKHTKSTKSKKNIKQTWKNDMENIKGYVKDYKKSCKKFSFNPSIFLDL